MDKEGLEAKLIETFKSDPVSFMNICLKHSEINGELHSFCKYVQLVLNFKLKNDLSDFELNEKQDLEEKYGEINVNPLINKNFQQPTIESAYEELKESIKQIYKDVQKAHEKNPSAGHAGFLEYTKSIRGNIIFARNDIPNKGAKYNLEIRSELSEYLKNFQGEVNLLANRKSAFKPPPILRTYPDTHPPPQ